MLFHDLWKLYESQILVSVMFYGNTGMLIYLSLVCGWFHTRMAELSSCHRDHMTYKPENIDSPNNHRKGLLTPDLASHFSLCSCLCYSVCTYVHIGSISVSCADYWCLPPIPFLSSLPHFHCLSLCPAPFCFSFLSSSTSHTHILCLIVSLNMCPESSFRFSVECTWYFRVSIHTHCLTSHL